MNPNIAPACSTIGAVIVAASGSSPVTFWLGLVLAVGSAVLGYITKNKPQ